jgi:hypothetical protein
MFWVEGQEGTLPPSEQEIDATLAGFFHFTVGTDHVNFDNVGVNLIAVDLSIFMGTINASRSIGITVGTGGFTLESDDSNIWINAAAPGGGTANVNIDAFNTVTIDGADIQLTSADGDIDISATSPGGLLGGTVDIDGAVSILLDSILVTVTSANGDIEINATSPGGVTGGTVDIDAFNAVEIDAGAGGVSVNATAGDLSLSTTTSGDISISTAEDFLVEDTTLTKDILSYVAGAYLCMFAPAADPGAVISVNSISFYLDEINHIAMMRYTEAGAGSYTQSLGPDLHIQDDKAAVKNDDEVLIWSTADGAYRKCTVANLLAATP